MKIVYVLDAMANKAGTERMISFKMNYLSEKDYEVYFITASQGKHPFSFNLSPKITCIDLNINFHRIYKYKLLLRLFKEMQLYFLLKKRTKKVISIIDPDIIIATTYSFSDIVCNLDCKAKKIIESHCNKNFLNYVDKNKMTIKNIYKSIKRNIIIKSIEDKCDAFVTLTEGDCKLWSDVPNRIVIPNPISLNQNEYSTLRNKRVISIGRLEPQKGFDMLIDAWKILYSKHNDWCLDIYGDGGLHDTLESQIKNLGLSDSCKIHSATNDISSKYLESSIYAMSSLYEGFGLVLIEAMSFGIPCVSFNCPYGPSDIISDNKDGILVEPNNVLLLADSINYLIENEDKRFEYGRQAKINVQKFSSENIMPKWDKLFKSLAN